MSKKKGKAAPKKKMPMKKARSSPARSLALATGEVAAGGRTVAATIFIYRTGTGNKIRTTPQRLYANPADRIEWSVVNLVDGSDVPVTISWPDAGPWGKDPIEFRGWHRKPLGAAPPGQYKYKVSALDAVEDPEIDIPDV